MKKNRHLPSPITILMAIIVLAAIASWLIPAGKYHTLAKSENESFILSTPKGDTNLAFTQKILDSLQIKIPLEKFASGAIRKPVSIPGTYQQLDRNGQGLIQILTAPVKGIYDTIDIILFILVIGGFMHVFNESGAMIKGLTALSKTMKGNENWLIIILTFLFSFGGASYGMAEEGLVFYPIMVPLFLAAGYDLLVPVAVIFAGTQLGTLSSFSNPFSVIIASNAAGINWQDGILERIIMFVLSTGLTIGYIVWYGNKIRKNPAASYVFKVDGPVASPYPKLKEDEKNDTSLSFKTQILLLLFLSSFLIMIFGVIKLEWWLPEMTTLFLGGAILMAIILRLNEKLFIQQFIKGAESLLSVAFIVGVARGVTIILNDGKISDSILFYSAKLAGGLTPVIFILVLLALYMLFTLFISSSSGMAVLTMPIIGALAILVNVPGKEVVNAYLFGMGIMGFITPTGLILPSLALVNVSFKAWMKFIFPLLVMLLILCAIFLVGGLYW